MRCYNMDGGKFFAQAVQEAYTNRFRPAQIIPSKRAEKREARRQKDAKIPKVDVSSSAEHGGGHDPASTSASASASKSQSSADPVPEPDQSEYNHLGRFVDHFVLNLPATAIEFLGSFQNLYQPFVSTTAEDKSNFLEALRAYSIARGQKDGTRFPMVHCYCFTKELDRPEEDICEVGWFIHTSFLGPFL